MKNVALILLLVFLQSCIIPHQDARIQMFESFLGKEYSNLLTQRVELLDNFVKINFKQHNIMNGYRDYLFLIGSGNYKRSDWKYDTLALKTLDDKFLQSGLWKEIWQKPDSVWVVDQDRELRYQYTYHSDTFITEGITSLTNANLFDNEDSVIKREIDFIEFNQFGMYLRGLRLVSEGDSILESYIDAKEASGNIPPSIIANALLDEQADLSDYFIKRIIAIEMF